MNKGNTPLLCLCPIGKSVLGHAEPIRQKKALAGGVAAGRARIPRRNISAGMDTLAVVKMLDRLEQEMNLVILPPFCYGASSYAVEPPEGNGSVHVSGETLFPFAKELFRGLLRIGFRNTHFFIHHQTENLTVGMPTDLPFKFAARQAIFEFMEAEHGEGWWGNNRMASYYAKQATDGTGPDTAGRHRTAHPRSPAPATTRREKQPRRTVRMNWASIPLACRTPRLCPTATCSLPATSVRMPIEPTSNGCGSPSTRPSPVPSRRSAHDTV